MCMQGCFSRFQLCATPWMVARQAPLSMGFSRREHWSGLPGPPPGGLRIPGIKPASPAAPVAPALQVGSLPRSHWEAPSDKYRVGKYLTLKIQSRAECVNGQNRRVTGSINQQKH